MEGEDNKNTNPCVSVSGPGMGKVKLFHPYPEPFIQTNTHPGSLPGPHIPQGLLSSPSLHVWDFLLSRHPHLPDPPSVGGFPV